MAVRVVVLADLLVPVLLAVLEQQVRDTQVVSVLALLLAVVVVVHQQSAQMHLLVRSQETVATVSHQASRVRRLLVLAVEVAAQLMVGLGTGEREPLMAATAEIGL